MKKILYLIFLLPQFLLAQCVIDKQIDSLYYYHPELHPSINPSHLLLKQFTIDFAATISDRSVDEIVIPVVYHIVHDNGDENISEEQIIESLLQVNEDFNALNPEIPDVHDSFQSLISDVGITFKLAEFNPNGEPTTGINRIQSDLTYNGGNIALKELVQWPPDQYLNIWVVYSSDGSNGSAFAFYPADVVGSGSIYDGIVASYWAVGRTGTAIPSHYKILSHEIGHWANLMHTWGDGSSNQSASGCSFDDGVDDTPNTIGNSGCILEAVSCESQDNVQNYMDYSNCSAMFTEGQKTRMLAALYSSVGNRDDIWSDENLEQVFIQQDILPRIVYSSGNYNEHSGNDGTVEDTIAIQLLDLSFSSLGTLEQGVDYSTLNLPAGLDLNIQVIDSTNAIIVMQGQVSEHSLVNSVNNIEIHFTSNPFNSVVLDDIYNPSKTNVSLTFIDPYSIVFVDKVNDLHNLLEGTNWNWFSYGVGSADFGLWTYDKDNFKLEIYSNAGVCYNGTRNLIPFESGELIGPANTFTYYDGYPSQLDIYNEDYTEWAGKIAYAGVTFQLSGNQHYGWLRIKVNNDASEAWVMDMAYNEAPNQPIITGEVQTPVISTSQNVFYESNDNDGSIRSIRRFDLHGSEFVDFESTPINNGFSITNLPSGLSAILNRVDSTTIQIELTGNAISHNASSIPITIIIDPSLIDGTLPNNLSLGNSIIFEDAYQVVYQDVDDFTVSSSGDDWHWFSIGLSDYGLWYNNQHLRIETYGKSLVSIPNTELVSSIGFGEQIQENLTWEYSAYCYECQPIVYSSNYTSWAGDTAYVGLKIPYQENFHYGWLRLSVTEDGSAMTLLDYAYNQAPNSPIATSQGCNNQAAINFNTEATIDDGSCIVLGCTNSDADNYNPGATEDDGSCIIYGCTDNIAFNYNENANEDDGSCIAVVIGCVDELAFNYNPEANTEDNSCIAVVNGCMDELALNYNPEANTDNNGLCFFDYDVLGCMDSLANNYSEIATYDDGTCQYPGLSLNPVPTELCLGDSVLISWTGGNPNDDIYISLDNVSTNTSTGQNDIVANTGEYIWVIQNIPPGPGDIYKFYIQDYPWPPESWSHGSHFTICPIYGCTNIDAFNYNPNATFDDGTCLGDILGCTNSDACNYNEDAIQDDNSCELPEEGYDCFGECLYDANEDGVCEDVYYGCLDSLANNYNVNANEDDGSCQYPGLSLNPVPTELCLGDSILISWTGGNPYGDVKVKLINVTTWTGAGQIDVVQNTGEYTWVVQNAPPGPGDTYRIDIEEYPGPPESSSHGSHFTICPIYGCTNIEAVNYNPNATFDDGTCLGDILGCTNSDACNYDEDATVDDGNCYYAGDYYDCDGDCLNDIDLDGVCDDLEVVGCQNVLACNFNEFATDAALCLFPDLYYNCENQCNNDVDTDGVCDELEIFGCQDVQACNYNSSATDNDLCIFIDGVCESCSDGVIIENDEDSDGICDIDEVFGCTNPEAFNYNLQATQEDNSCIDIVFGCMDPQAINYNPIANTPNSNCEFVCQSPVSWDYANTGINHTLMIPSEIDITISGQLISFGSTIGVFYTNENGELQCAGSTSIVDETTFIAVMGDDSTTDQIDGLQEGQDFIWMIWDILTCEQYELYPSYSEGPTTFTVNGLTFLDALEHYTCQQVVLPGGWYTYSSYIQADDMDAELVMSSIVDNLVILKDNVGNAYLTEWAFNGIGELDFHFGYQLKTNTSDTLEICGLQMYPEDHPIILQSGWNLISYLRVSPSAVDVVLEDLNSNDNLLIVKDYNGNPYLPEWDFNGIGDMSPGQGYQLKVYEPDTINYLSNDLEYRISTTQVVENRVDYFAKASPTGNNMHIVIPQDAWDVIPELGSEIAAYNSDGILVGSAKYSNPTTVLTLWGDDITTKTIDGLLIDEPVVFKVWDKQQISDYKIENWAVGANTYQVNAINVAAAIEIENFIETTNLFDAIPNPTQTKTNISFFVAQAHRVNISVYNIVGELVVVLANSDYDVGFHQLEMDVSQIEAGTYFYTMRSGEYEKTKQLIILK